MNPDHNEHRLVFVGALLEILEGLITIFSLTLYRPNIYAKFLRWKILYQIHYRRGH